MKLYNGDCLELMKSIPDGSVDMVLCDLPYGTTQNRWDTCIPFAPLWEHWHRVCKKNAAILLFGQMPFTAALVMSNQKEFRYEWIYEKTIQPYQFGHPYSKRTCLWLKGLPILMATDIIMEGVTPYVNGGCKDAHGNYRRVQGRKERDPKIRAKTFPGIAKAMAEQWAGNNSIESQE